MKKIIYLIGICMALTGCAKKVANDVITSDQLKYRVIGGDEISSAIPQASVFKMNGPYQNNVAVTLKPDGTLLYYPAPTDIMVTSAPYDLGGGWWLNRQGVSQNSVFTKWTFEEYSKMKSVPTREEIMEAIIPGSRVTEIEKLPITISEAFSNPGACRKYINR